MFVTLFVREARGKLLGESIFPNALRTIRLLAWLFLATSYDRLDVNDVTCSTGSSNLIFVVILEARTIDQ